MRNFTKCMLAAVALTAAANISAQTSPWAFVSAGSEQTYAIKADGTLWAWGSAEYGELGNGSKTPGKVSVPTQIGTDTNWKFAAGGSGRAFFIKADGTMWSTGTAEGGVLGTNSAVSATTPAQISEDTDWAYVATSNQGDNYDAMAIKTDGTLWAWGKNRIGELGLGDNNARAVPVQSGTDNDWVAVSIGRAHTLALKSDGSIWGCGEGQNGAIGGDAVYYNPSWIKVAEPADWKYIYAIDNASYAIKADGTLWAWGDNLHNILGIGDNGEVNVTTPTQITAITEKVFGFSGGQYNRVVIVGEGENATKAYAWGYDYSGALGNGTGSDFGDVENLKISIEPVEVKLDNVGAIKTVSTGQNFSVVLTEAGKLFGWGSNAWGQLGTSEPENKLGEYKTTPIAVAEESETPDAGAEFDAANIPASLDGVEKITLTGEWGTEDFQKLITPLGNGQGIMGFNYNRSLKTVDMQQVTFKENTSLEKVFRNCTVLESVLTPANESVANVVSLEAAFMNDAALSFIDITNFVNVSNLNQAFQGCKSIVSFDLSKWVGVEYSELAFQNCVGMTSIALPGKFEIDDRCFGSCDNLRLIDWSTFSGTTIPTVEKDNAKYQPFYNLDFLPGDQAKITVIVPDASYGLFESNPYWSNFTLQRAQLPGSYTIDAAEIPASLADAIHITLTGEWNTAKFAELAKALGTASGITASNSTLVSVDMSAAVIAENTKLKMAVPGALFGTTDKGVFQKFTALETVVMPAPGQAANFTSFVQAFQDCSSLKSIDLSGCTGLTETNAAFYNCSSLETVKLPKAMPLKKELFDRCTALKTIDWSLYEGVEAPALPFGVMPQFIDPANPKDLTIIVPEAAYDSFVASDAWGAYTIQKDSTSGVEDTVVAEEEIARPVYSISGKYITTLAPGQTTTELPAGIYIIGGKKIMVR